jgi:hypothetical protein
MEKGGDAFQHQQEAERGQEVGEIERHGVMRKAVSASASAVLPLRRRPVMLP